MSVGKKVELSKLAKNLDFGREKRKKDILFADMSSQRESKEKFSKV
jgi:hypothetical protein